MSAYRLPGARAQLQVCMDNLRSIEGRQARRAAETAGARRAELARSVRPVVDDEPRDEPRADTETLAEATARLAAKVRWERRPDRPSHHPDDCDASCCWRRL